MVIFRPQSGRRRAWNRLGARPSRGMVRTLSCCANDDGDTDVCARQQHEVMIVKNDGGFTDVPGAAASLDRGGQCPHQAIPYSSGRRVPGHFCLLPAREPPNVRLIYVGANEKLSTDPRPAAANPRPVRSRPVSPAGHTRRRRKGATMLDFRRISSAAEKAACASDFCASTCSTSGRE